MVFICINLDWNCFWTALTAIFTLFLVLVGYDQLEKFNETNKRVFLQNLKNDFFTDYERTLMFLIDNKYLIFNTIKLDGNEIYNTKNEISFFINTVDNRIDFIIDEIPLLKRKYFTSNEIDDFLLQHFEDIGILYENENLTKEDIVETFGYYLETCWGYKEIHTYINHVREVTKDNDIYMKFENLCNKLGYEKPIEL